MDDYLVLWAVDPCNNAPGVAGALGISELEARERLDALETHAYLVETGVEGVYVPISDDALDQLGDHLRSGQLELGSFG